MQSCTAKGDEVLMHWFRSRCVAQRRTAALVSRHPGHEMSQDWLSDGPLCWPDDPLRRLAERRVGVRRNPTAEGQKEPPGRRCCRNNEGTSFVLALGAVRAVAARRDTLKAQLRSQQWS